jgi:hypothetical protein
VDFVHAMKRFLVRADVVSSKMPRCRSPDLGLSEQIGKAKSQISLAERPMAL